MRILQVASGDFLSTLGGGQVYVKNIVDEMVNRGLDVTVLSFTDNNKATTYRYKNSVVYGVPENTGEQELGILIDRIKPDIIHAHSNKALICRLGHNRNIPVITTSHHGGIACPAGAFLDYADKICNKRITHNNCLPCVLRNTKTGLKLWYPIVKFIPKKTYLAIGKFLRKRRPVLFLTPVGIAALQIEDKNNCWNEVKDKCTLMIAPCYGIADSMVNNGLNKDKIVILPHGIPLPKERHISSPLNRDKLKFYYTGRMCPVKGVHILVEAFHSIDNPDIELHLIGGGKYEIEPLVEKLKKRYPNDSRIIWHGKVPPDQIFDITREFDVSVAPTICLEIFGLNIAEALSLGKPVIATRCGGAEMQIKDGYNGWLVEPNNVEALKERMEYVIDHRSILPKMSNNCAAISIQEHCDKLLEIYKSLIS